MRNRWGILAVLFAVRLAMAFQFQSVAAVAPLLGHEFGVGLADIGRPDRALFHAGRRAGVAGRRDRTEGSATRPRCSRALLLMLVGGLAMALLAFLERADRGTAGRRRRRRAAQRSDDEDGDRLVCGQGDRDRDGDLRQFMAGRDRALAADAALDRHRLRHRGGLSRGGSADRAAASCCLPSAYQPPANAATVAAASARLDRSARHRRDRRRG